MNTRAKPTSRRLLHIVAAIGSLTVVFLLTRKGETERGGESDADTRPVLSAVSPKRQLSEQEAHLLAPKSEIGEVPFTELYAERSANTETWKEEAPEFYRAWGEAEGAVAAEHALELGGSSATGLAGTALAGWAGRDLNAAQQWVDDYHDGRERMLLARAVIATIPESPQGPGEWVARLATSEYSAGLLSGVAQDIAGEESGASAVDWISELPEGRSRDQALQRLVSDWTADDPRSVSEKLSTMEGGTIKDRAVSIFCQRIAAEDATSARQWAETIADEQVRTSTLALVARFEPATVD